MTVCALRENAVPGEASGGTSLAIFVISRMNEKTAAKIAMFFMVRVTQDKE
jgi:hypothetical protein